MPEVVTVLNLVIEVAFALLAIRTAVSWTRQPDRSHGFLTLAVGSLTALVLLSGNFYSTGFTGRIGTDAGIVLFLLSGFGLLMFRNTLLPRSSRTLWAAIAAIVVAGAVAIAAQIAPTGPPRTPFEAIAVVLLVAVWAYCVLEPIVSFWSASGGRPAVERERLRAMSIGYLGLLTVIVIGSIANALGLGLALLVDLITLAVVPILYGAFFPPAWLRRIWRQPDEDEFRRALHDLLLYSPDRATLASRALGWAERLVAGKAEFLVDSDGSILALRGIAEPDAQRIMPALDGGTAAHGRDAPWLKDSALVVPLDLHEGPGMMVILTGGRNAMFGDDELSRLRQYAASITAGLDRVALNSRIAALERAKSDFLSIASHELRGPMTVIKGYLTMVDSGSLGDVSAKVQSVLPLLISKADEVNWMIEQMIEASRLEEGRLALKRHRLDIVELTDIAADGVKMLLGNHDLHVDSPAEPIEAEVDPDRFQIVIRNLLSNAAKYSPAGTDIDLRVRRDGSVAFVSVQDHGVGIAKKDQGLLFNRFSRIENHGHVPGTGLGLWLSREIARLHDGDLTVESEVGHGSTFTLKVPLAG